ncbi:penicillin-binding transpeptidase domain-containing protein [Thermocatellispora tengchongensis]|uniref:penicillin-binding transpeptidase domain-containing protein n=1 Tax=Thermocatellispora tengchongensis TaxID=1073253 RepID=UPI00362C1084
MRARSLVGGGDVDGAPQTGTIRLTIDAAVQRAAYRGLRAAGRRGAVAALDPATGAILALASYPTYNPNRYATFDPARLERVERRLGAAPGTPLLNRALQRTYPPGAAFQIVTAAAALGRGGHTPLTKVSVPAGAPGSPTACSGTRMALARAFAASCGTAFGRLGAELRPGVLREQAEGFGFNAGDLTVPLRVAPSVYPARLDRAGSAPAAIGRGGVRATPLGLAMTAAAVANGGALMRPYLVQEVRLADGTSVEGARVAQYRRPISLGVAGELAAMLAEAARPGGAAENVALPGVEVAAMGSPAAPMTGPLGPAAFGERILGLAEPPVAGAHGRAGAVPRLWCRRARWRRMWWGRVWWGRMWWRRNPRRRCWSRSRPPTGR